MTPKIRKEEVEIRRLRTIYFELKQKHSNTKRCLLQIPVTTPPTNCAGVLEDWKKRGSEIWTKYCKGYMIQYGKIQEI